jgi:hypothetical protein
MCRYPGALGVSLIAGLVTPSRSAEGRPLGRMEKWNNDTGPGARAETPESQKYVGLSRDDALKAADTAGVKPVRVIEGSQHLSADFRSDRLNILVADGYVKKAAFFSGLYLPQFAHRVGGTYFAP